MKSFASGQNIESILYNQEFFSRVALNQLGRARWEFVRVVVPHEPPVRSLYFFGGCVSAHAKGFVVVETSKGWFLRCADSITHEGSQSTGSV